MMNGLLRTFVLCAMIVMCGAAWAATLDDAPANTWVQIHRSEKSGQRSSPIFFYEPAMKKFVLSGGVARGARHYDNEEFDLKTLKWTNAYPKGAPAEYAPESGPSKAPFFSRRNEKKLRAWTKDAAGYLRIPWWGSYGNSSMAYWQWTYDTDAKKLVAYIQNKTVIYDPATRLWSMTGVKPFSKGTQMHWGSLCYDPINQEIVSVGGTSDEKGGTPGTWTYWPTEKKWEKLSFKRNGDGIRTEVQKTKRLVWALMSACRNRLHSTETPKEAKLDLAKLAEQARKSVAPLEPFADVREVFKKAGFGPLLTPVSGHIGDAAKGLTSLATTLKEPVTAKTIVAAQSVYDTLERLERSIDVEPAGRALSQMVYDPVNEKIVLFGGDGLDRHYGDTWVYDCRARTWEQRFPKVNPSPRAGHAMLWLPKAKKILLVGGYALGDGHSYMYGDAYWARPFEMWTYDVAKNEWACLKHIPLPPYKRGYGPDWKQKRKGMPRGGVRGTWPMAVNEDDTVLFFTNYGRAGSATWTCKVDATKADAKLTKKHGVPPETVAFRGDENQPGKNRRSYDPAFYDRHANTNTAKTEAWYKKLPANQWTLLSAPKQVDKCGWGTTAYDSDRQQFLFWGGGHSEYKGTNVFHFSQRTGSWSMSARPDWVLEASGGFLLPCLVSFRNDRPHVPVHAYQTYAYDPPSGKMIAVKNNTYFLYNVANREWESFAKTPFPNRGVMWISLETTPKGVVAWTQDGQLWRFEKTAWKKLPLKGVALKKPWCDGSGFAYDPDRDCLWGDPRNGKMFRYDIKTGVAEHVATTPPKRLGKFALWREQVVLPGENLILLMRPFGGKNVAFDTKTNKWHEIAMPFIVNGKPYKGRRGGTTPRFSWTSAMHYDAKRKLVFLHNPISFWVLRFDRKTAKMSEIGE
jgi:galactose oxidase-like protein